jgi:hypothetical protein
MIRRGIYATEDRDKRGRERGEGTKIGSERERRGENKRGVISCVT